MKFGKRLENETLERFRGFYIQYKELKKALKVFTGQERDQATVQEVTHWTSSFLRLGPNPEVPPKAKLNTVLESELKRVSKFAALQEEGLRSELGRLEEGIAAGGGAGREASWKRLEELGEQLVQLKSFQQLNFTGFRKILKKYDKWSKSAVLTWFMGKVMRAPLMCVDYESLLLTLNRIAMSLTDLSKGSSASFGEAGGSTNGMALLVHPKDTMWVKVQLALHLRLAPSTAAAQGAGPARPRVSSCYFDTPDFDVYNACVADAPSGTGSLAARPPLPPPCALLHLREEGADDVRLVRMAPGGSAPIEVPLTRLEAEQLVRGQYVATPASAHPAPPGSVSAEAVLGEFRGAVGRGLRPVAQSSSRNSSFREESSLLAATLEEDIKLARVKEWGRQASSMDFLPFNVLQITRAPPEPPKWLRRIYDSPSVMQVAGFSLSLHATARCCAKDAVLSLPHWYRSLMETFSFSDDEEKQSEPYSDESQPKQKSSGKASSSEAVQESGSHEDSSSAWRTGSGTGARLLHEFGPEQVKETAPGDARAPAPEGGLGAPLLDRPAASSSSTRRTGLLAMLFGQGARASAAVDELPVRQAIVTVQPKTLYSNERTFLEWIHVATIFASLGIGLMHSAPRASGMAIGRLLVALAIFLVIWALNTFNWRSDALDRKEIRSYHDPVGPPVLILGMLATLVLACMAALDLI